MTDKWKVKHVEYKDNENSNREVNKRDIII